MDLRDASASKNPKVKVLKKKDIIKILKGKSLILTADISVDNSENMGRDNSRRIM